MNELSNDKSPLNNGDQELRSHALQETDKVQHVIAGEIPLGQEEKIKKKKIEKPKIDSMESFLSISIHSHRISLNERTLKVLKVKPVLAPDIRVRLLEDMSKIDVDLEFSRQLMFVSLSAYSFPQVAKSIREFARDVIVTHFALKPVLSTDLFSSNKEENVCSLADIFPSNKEENVCSLADISKRLGRFRKEEELRMKAKVKEKEKKEPNTEENNPKDNFKALGNAILASAAWRVSLELSSIEEVIFCFSKESFPYKSEDRQREYKALSFIGSVQDRTGLSAILSCFAELVEQERKRSAYLSSQLQVKEGELQQIQANYSEARNKITELEKRVESLKGELSNEKEQRRVDLVHQKDDMNRQRSHTLRVIENDIQLISESLIALTREPPKINVAQNYITNVFESLNGEIKFLKEP